MGQTGKWGYTVQSIKQPRQWDREALGQWDSAAPKFLVVGRWGCWDSGDVVTVGRAQRCGHGPEMQWDSKAEGRRPVGLPAWK